MFRNNWQYKVLALAIALIIWAYANESQNTDISAERTLRLELRGLSSDLLAAARPETVKVLLEGPKSHVNSIIEEPDGAAAYVDVSGKAPGEYTLPVRAVVPESFRALIRRQARPAHALVTLTRKARRTCPVEVQFVGLPPVGYRFGTPKFSPKRVVVTGPERTLKQVSRLVVAVDPRIGGSKSVDGEFPVAARDSHGQEVHGVRVSPESVHLSMDLLEAPASRLVFVSLDTVGQPPFPYRVEEIDIRPDTLTLTGRPELLMNISTLRTEPVHLSDRTKTFGQRVKVIVPAELSAEADGSYVNVTVRIGRTTPAEPPDTAPE